MQSRPPRAAQALEETLDPGDWADAQAVAHRAVDDAIAYLRDIRDRPVWQYMPCEVRRTFETHLPRSPTPLSKVYRESDRCGNGSMPSAWLSRLFKYAIDLR